MKKVLRGVLHFIFFASVIFLIFYCWSGLVEYLQGTSAQPYSAILQVSPFGVLAILAMVVVAGTVITWKKLE